MKKLIYKIIIVFVVSFFIFISYFSLVGFETKRFNSQIINKIGDLNSGLELKLNKVKLTLDPFKFQINAKTLGSQFYHNKKSIDFEYIKTKISLRSLIKNEFSLTNLDASTKSIEIKKLISFIQSLNHSAELFILEKFIKKGYLLADIKLNFDENGKLKDNFKINGFVKDTKINILKDYKVKDLDFIFNLNGKNLKIQDLELSLNNVNFLSKELNIDKVEDEFLFNGEMENKNSNLKNAEIDLFLKPFFQNINIKKVELNSKNKFSFRLNNKLKLKDFQIKSFFNIQELLVENSFKLNKVFPNIKEEISFSDQKLEIEYKKNDLIIKGSGNILLQNQSDKIDYKLNVKNKIYNFETLLEIYSNSLNLDILNYKKSIDNNAIIKIKGSKKLDNKIKFDLITLEEKNNKISINNLLIDEKIEIIGFDSINFNFLDQTDNINKFEFIKIKNDYYLQGPILNADHLIESFINNDDNSNKILNKKIKIFVKIDNLLLDKNYKLKNFEGSLALENQEIISGNLEGLFSKNKKFKFTVKSINTKKITTLFLDEADTMVNRYRFIKGFKGGSLDFYSTKQNNETLGKIKIYDFKLKELPALTKLLTLASLQGIADLVSGEGISFDEFEMTFKNKKNIMTIDEIYAIGPAISILLKGYVEKNKLVSLRGTLVPATTINKVIGSIPILGDILVGSKTGEGVFGVSFKIKGPPKKLETTVNPIKTLTPRFITRTLEKIKKTN